MAENKRVADPSAHIEIQVNTANHSEMHTVSENEVLCASPIACAVADAWTKVRKRAAPYLGAGGATITETIGNLTPSDLIFSLDSLATATRNSPLRKVKT